MQSKKNEEPKMERNRTELNKVIKLAFQYTTFTIS